MWTNSSYTWLLQLHWLPGRWRIQYKLCAMMHLIHIAKCPTYLNDIVETVASSSSHSGLRSSTTNTYVTSRLRTKFGEQAFLQTGHTAWNLLLVNIRAKTSQVKFKKTAKHSFLISLLPANCIFIFRDSSCRLFYIHLVVHYVVLVISIL